MKQLSRLISQAPKKDQAPIKELVTENAGILKFQKKQKFYTTNGPMYYISKLLWEKGPLTSHQIWKFYNQDTNKPTDKELFRSKNYLKKKILRDMIRNRNFVEKAGYDKQKKQFLGFKIRGEEALKNVHPDLLLNLQPIPQFAWMKRKDIQARREELEKNK